MTDAIAPGFLVAVPSLTDPNFDHTVVLLLEQGSSGALGIVVNRESPLSLEELCHDHKIPYSGDPEKMVRHGGPVQPEQGLVVYSEEHSDPEGRPVVQGLHVSASTGTLTRLCNLARGRFQCFSGYAGWAPGQLEQEITQGSWILIPLDARLVLDSPPEQMWNKVLTNHGLDPAAIVPGDHEA